MLFGLRAIIPDEGNDIVISHRAPALALQLCFLWISESMGNHDSNVVGACSVC